MRNVEENIHGGQGETEGADEELSSCKNGRQQNGTRNEKQLSEGSEHSGGAGKSEDRELSEIL